MPRRRRTLNEQLLDDLLHHAGLLPQFEDAELRQAVRILDRAHREIKAEITARIRDLVERGIATATDRQLGRLRALQRDIRGILLEAYQRLGKRLTADLRAFAREEADFYAGSLGRLASLTNGALVIHTLAPELLRAIVTDDPFQGRLLADWVEKLAGDEFNRLKNAIDQGLVVGDSMDGIIRRIYGTRGRPKFGAAVFTSRREVETIVRTAVQHVSARVQAETVAANLDIVSAVRWLATLDSDTCELCMARDGHLYDPATKEPLDQETREKVSEARIAAAPGAFPPWGDGPGKLHFRCRCVEQIVVKSLRELGIDLDQRDVEGRRAATTPAGLVNGDVPASTTYPDWLRTQPRHVVDDILGEARAELFLSGKLEFSQLFEPTGEFLTVGELRERFGRILEEAGF